MKKAVFAIAAVVLAGSVSAKPPKKPDCPGMTPLCFPELGVKNDTAAQVPTLQAPVEHAGATVAK